MHFSIPVFTSALFWVALWKIMIANVILSGDNAVVIAMAARNLNDKHRRAAIVFGGAGAIVLLIIFCALLGYLLDVPYLKLVGGALLLWIGVKLVGDEEVKDGGFQFIVGGAGDDRLDIMDEFVADEANGAAGEAGQAGDGDGAVAFHDAFDDLEAILGVRAEVVGLSDAAVFDDLNLAVVLADDGAGVAANEGVAADVFAALDGFKEEGFTGAADLAIGGQGRLKIGEDAARDGDEIPVGGILQKFIQ